MSVVSPPTSGEPSNVTLASHKNGPAMRIDVVTDVPTQATQPGQSITHVLQYTGIVPPPDVAAGWERVRPGAAERILSISEGEVAHRRELERLDMQSIVTCRAEDLRQKGRGQIFALIVVLAFAIGGVVLMALGQSAGGLTAIVVGAGALAANFLERRRESREP